MGLLNPYPCFPGEPLDDDIDIPEEDYCTLTWLIELLPSHRACHGLAGPLPRSSSSEETVSADDRMDAEQVDAVSDIILVGGCWEGVPLDSPPLHVTAEF